METWLSLKDTTSSFTRGLLPLAMGLIYLVWRWVEVLAALHYHLWSLHPNSATTQFWISCHQASSLIISLWRIIYGPSGRTPFIQNFASWLSITLSNRIIVDDLPTRKPLNSLTSSLPVTLSWATCSPGHTRVYTHKMFFWWKIPLFRFK